MAVKCNGSRCKDVVELKVEVKDINLRMNEMNKSLRQLHVDTRASIDKLTDRFNKILFILIGVLGAVIADLFIKWTS